MSTRARKTFTLIEMLIVIVIIGILAAALVPRLQDVQSRARDTKRKTDISQLHQAIMIYQADNGNYPQAHNAIKTCSLNTNCYVFSIHTTGNWISTLTGVLTSFPLDPLNTQNGIWSVNVSGPWYTGNQVYAYGNVYTPTRLMSLFAWLENRRDPDRCELQAYKWNTAVGSQWDCSNTSFCGAGQNCYQMYIRSDLGN